MSSSCHTQQHLKALPLYKIIPTNFEIHRGDPHLLRLLIKAMMDAPIYADKQWSEDVLNLMGGSLWKPHFIVLPWTFPPAQGRVWNLWRAQHQQKVFSVWLCQIHDAATDYFWESQVLDAQMVRGKIHLRCLVHMFLNVDDIRIWQFVLGQQYFHLLHGSFSGPKEM